jgi:hypothetical protein
MRIARTCQARERHRGHQDDEADHRSLDHDLAAVAIAEPAPRRRQHGGQRRRHAEAHAGPDRNRSDAGDPELRDEQRQKRHDEREPGEAQETRDRHRPDVPLPAVARSARFDAAGVRAVLAHQKCILTFLSCAT